MESFHNLAFYHFVVLCARLGLSDKDFFSESYGIHWERAVGLMVDIALDVANNTILPIIYYR